MMKLLNYILCSTRNPAILTTFLLVNLVAFILVLLHTQRVLKPLTDNKINENLPYPTIEDSVKNDSNNITKIIQISDLHLSIFSDPNRITEFSDFCGETLDTISPSVVLATGDLTHGRPLQSSGSREYIEEWILYRDTLEENNVVKKTIWLDLRGNHDNFDILNINASNNYFRQYSVQGPKNSKSYSYEYKTLYGETISFISVDATLGIGTVSAFNKFGDLTNYEIKRITKFLKQATHSNHIIWFGHYPTSTITSKAASILKLLIGSSRKTLVYVCGHLHKIENEMYVTQKEGYTELELADWMENRMYRVMAIDHGYLSFVDVKHGQWPVILVTNPPPIVLNPITSNEDISNYKRLTSHVRILVFSKNPIRFVKIKIDEEEWKSCEYVSESLYVAYWNHSKYMKGIHTIYVSASDTKGKRNEISQKFSAELRTKPKFLVNLLLTLNWTSLMNGLFLIMMFVILIPLVSCRYLRRYRKYCFSSELLSSCLQGFYVISNADCFYYPLILYPIYMLIGPWAVGNLLTDEIGVIFSWGVIIDWTYIPLSFMYLVGPIQCFGAHIILIVLIAWRMNPNVPTRRKLIIWDILFLFVIISIFVESYWLYLVFGEGSLLLYPVKLVWLTIALFIRCEVCFNKRWKYFESRTYLIEA